MAIYHIYTAIEPNGNLTALAVDPDLIGVHDKISEDLGLDSITKIEDFFVPGTLQIEHAGEIEIQGNLSLIDSWFCVRH